MAGTREGGRKAAITNKQKYGEGFYSKIGTEGGKLGTTGGFAKQVVCYETHGGFEEGRHYVRNCAGQRGGRISRRKSKETISG